jgi:hypothetical protein
MKKKSRKLALHRETIAALDQHSLGLARGGTSVTVGYSRCYECSVGCPYSGYGTCNTCEGLCTTNYC